MSKAIAITDDLRVKFDEIDALTITEGSRPYCNWKIADAHGGWRKGWAVITKYPAAADYKGQHGGDRKSIGVTPLDFSWDTIAGETGRSDKSIKAWIELAKKIGPGEERFKLWATEAKDRYLGQFERKLIAGLKEDKPIFCSVQPNIFLESWETWLPKQKECDLLITDPPYSTDIDDIEKFAQAWLPEALGKLKPTGRAYVFIGAYPREVAAYLNVSLPNQLLVWEYRNTLGPMPSFDYILNWQAVLYYRGPDAPKWDDDILLDHTAVQNVGQERPSKHQWQKPMKLAEMLIKQSTNEGDLVIDPFSGTGTFLLAAGSLGRKAIGCEISQDMLDIAIKRGCMSE